jgi:hypothetical protein
MMTEQKIGCILVGMGGISGAMIKYVQVARNPRYVSAFTGA